MLWYVDAQPDPNGPIDLQCIVCQELREPFSCTAEHHGVPCGATVCRSCKSAPAVSSKCPSCRSSCPRYVPNPQGKRRLLMHPFQCPNKCGVSAKMPEMPLHVERCPLKDAVPLRIERFGPDADVNVAEAEALVLRYTQLWNVGRKEEGRNLLEEAHRRFPTTSAGWYAYGSMYGHGYPKHFDLAKCMKGFIRTIEIDPSHVLALCDLGTILCIKGDVMVGRMMYRRANHIDPSHVPTLAFLRDLQLCFDENDDCIPSKAAALQRRWSWSFQVMQGSDSSDPATH